MIPANLSPCKSLFLQRNFMKLYTNYLHGSKVIGPSAKVNWGGCRLHQLDEVQTQLKLIMGVPTQCIDIINSLFDMYMYDCRCYW